jgi:ATP-dependent DNA helicase
MQFFQFLFYQESDLLALLKQEQDEEEEFVQSAEISESNLQIALDRRDLLLDYEEGINPDVQVLPMKGPGWEVVIQGGSGGNLLSSIEGYRKVLPIDPTL